MQTFRLMSETSLEGFLNALQNTFRIYFPTNVLSNSFLERGLVNDKTK